MFLHCDDQSARLLSYYATIRDIATIAENAKQVLQQYVTAESGVENRELDQLNQVLNELSLLLQYNESFSRYFNGKAGDALTFVSQLPPLDRSYLDKYPSTSVLPVELTKTLAAIEQKKCIPQTSQLQSAKVSSEVVCDVDSPAVLPVLHVDGGEFCGEFIAETSHAALLAESLDLQRVV